MNDLRSPNARGTLLAFGAMIVATFGVLTAVHVAEGLTQPPCDDAAQEEFPTLDMDYLSAIGVTDRLPDWQRMMVDLETEEE